MKMTGDGAKRWFPEEEGRASGWLAAGAMGILHELILTKKVADEGTKEQSRSGV